MALQGQKVICWKLPIILACHVSWMESLYIWAYMFSDEKCGKNARSPIHFPPVRISNWKACVNVWYLTQKPGFSGHFTNVRKVIFTKSVDLFEDNKGQSLVTFIDILLLMLIPKCCMLLVNVKYDALLKSATWKSTSKNKYLIK